MKLDLICRNVKRKEVKTCLESAGVRNLPIDGQSATVKIVAEHRSRVGPPYRVWGRMVIPGPDLKAMASGHTLEAAVLHVVRQLERQWQLRQRHLQLNRRNRLQTRKATRDRYLKVLLGAGHVRCPIVNQRTERLRFVFS